MLNPKRNDLFLVFYLLKTHSYQYDPLLIVLKRYFYNKNTLTIRDINLKLNTITE
ncbi:hypothetical protein [Staphylothermus hellenicus]|uniref:hypothetical protein n=1 Tax=Staphylothermus hellenicus TaxID=84599 RepID=UPI00164FDE92|nr:hypothetical protein [Staphylothermus hellenicus]